MIAIELVRRDPELVRRAMLARGEADPVDELLALDAAWRRDRTQADEIRNRRNQVNREIGHARAAGQPPSPEVIAEMRSLGDQVTQLEAGAQEAEDRMRRLLLGLPNLPLPDVPVGRDADANRIVRESGPPAAPDFPVLPHWELGEKLGIIDFQRGAKLSGSRFYTTSGAGARLERALISWMLDLHTGEHGYTELALPAVVRREVMEGSGNLPKFADNLYRDAEDDLWLIPTAEVPITGLYRDEIIPPGRLPLRYVAQTPCFRREKAAAGRDTRGIKRVFSSTRWKCINSWRPRNRPPRWSYCWATPRKCAAGWGLPGGLSNCAPAIWVSPPPKPTILKSGPPAARNGWR